MSGSREHVLHYSEATASQRDTAGGPASGHLWTVSSIRGQERPQTPSSRSSPVSLVKVWPRRTWLLSASWCPRAFQTFQVKPHGTLWTAALHSCPESGGISLRGSIVGGWRLLELLCLHQRWHGDPSRCQHSPWGQEEGKSTCAVRWWAGAVVSRGRQRLESSYK